MNKETVIELANKYTKAWNSQKPANVASFFAEGATLYVNGSAATGRDAITEVAHSFMTAFPDMVVTLDRLVEKSQGVEFHWTLTGTNTGPGGTGRPVRISGHELWQMDSSGLISSSTGHFDALDYQRQLAGEQS